MEMELSILISGFRALKFHRPILIPPSNIWDINIDSPIFLFYQVKGLNDYYLLPSLFQKKISDILASKKLKGQNKNCRVY